MATVQRGRILDDQGKFEESIPCFDRAIAVFEDLGARWELGDATAERGIAKRELGRLDEAEEDLRKAIRRGAPSLRSRSGGGTKRRRSSG
jgi:tetratricopeptide (TPR) repeat protein